MAAAPKQMKCQEAHALRIQTLQLNAPLVVLGEVIDEGVVASESCRWLLKIHAHGDTADPCSVFEKTLENGGIGEVRQNLHEEDFNTHLTPHHNYIVEMCRHRYVVSICLDCKGGLGSPDR
jgi:hypothetical protein